ncbi:phospholipid-transporting ATPase ABCA3-like [Dermacentor variabilis]|uniref:phospholipid-transporting ATPase ABCA3-like n=1 Tax=Dermacentor variabilis TaxID=34621 RepID=UPI003F5B2715
MGVPRTWFWLVHYLCGMTTWTLGSMLLLAMMSQVNGPHGLAFIFRTNPMIVFSAMLIFNSGYILIGLFTSLFFDTASLGLACGLILWTVSLLGPFLSLEWSARTVSAYITTKSSAKIGASLIPIHGLYFFFRIVEFYESYDVPFGWPAIYRKALGRDNVTPFTIMLCMGASSFVFSVAIWYLEAVLPWTNVVPLPLHFPFMASYWNVIQEEIKVAGSQESTHSQEEGQENFEEEPRHLLLVLETIDLCKVYRNKFAVDHLNMRLYYGQIFVLLGHNGAGKTTTCSMLSGFLRPTFGTAIIEGFDLIKYHDDSLENVRLCPQKDMLYEDMTLYEHLYFFALVQRVAPEAIAEQIELLVKSLHFGSHLHSLPRAMPSGVKRKLVLAIAILADPKVLILDEPTAGLDPQSRHEVWDLLQKMRRTCTMLLTTHDMEEADVVGDRIAILAEGTIRCCGSSQFLKHRFGTGYHMDIGKRLHRCDVQGIIMVVKTYVPTVQLVSESAEVLRLSLGVTSSEGFVDMFKVLERFRSKLGIVEMSVSVTTMEDIYLRIADEMMEEHAESMTAAGAVPTHEPVDVAALRDNCDGCVWRKSTLQCLVALVRKRCQYARHQWTLPVLGIFAPALLLALQGYREARNTQATLNLADVYSYDINAMYNFTVASMLTSDEESLLVSQYFRQLMEEKTAEVTRVRDVTDYLLEVGTRSFDEYNKYVVGASFLLVGKKRSARQDPNEGVVQLGLSQDYEGRLVIAWYSGEFYHSAIIALNLVHTALLRWTVGDDTAAIKLRVRPQKNLEESVEYDKDSPEVIQRQLERFTFGAMSLATMTAACGLFPVADRVSGCRQLQLLTGLSVRVYWLANFLFDYFLYTLSTGCICGIMLLFYGAFFQEMMQPVLLLFACYGVCALSLGYLLTLAANSPSTGYALVLLLSFFGAFMTSGTIAAELLKTAVGIRFVLLNLLPLLRLMPSFAFMSAFLSTVSKSQLAWICSRSALNVYKRVCVEPAEGFSVAVEEERRNNKDFVRHCCPEFLRAGAMQQVPDFRPSLSDIDEVFLMLVECVIFTLLLLYLDSGGMGHLQELYGAEKDVRQTVPVHGTMDEDVEAEETRIRYQVVAHKMGSDIVAVLEFCKKFRTRTVVKGISFSVAEGEVLTVLGVPGSGKSTLLRMLATDLPHDRGRALMKTPRGIVGMRSDPVSWRAGIGYCPQREGLLEQLTGNETLALFARLRGVPESRVFAVARDVARLVGIDAVLQDYVASYSGGLRRRLSVGVALVGLPPVVLLDEPTVGVDVVSRRTVWEALHALQQTAKTTVIMTTGSMEEAEGVCDRLAIVIDGEFQCIGTLTHLRSKFAQGYTVTVKTHDEYKDDLEYRGKLMRAISDTFPNSNLQQAFEGFLEYHMPESGLPWHELFAHAEAIKRKLNLFEFLISNTTLDHVYAALARWERGRARRAAGEGSPGQDGGGSPEM